MKPESASGAPVLAFVAVIFDTPGVQSIGPYAAGIVHTVSDVEAQRLIAHKGFRLATPTPTPPQGGES